MKNIFSIIGLIITLSIFAPAASATIVYSQGDGIQLDPEELSYGTRNSCLSFAETNRVKETNKIESPQTIFTLTNQVEVDKMLERLTELDEQTRSLGQLQYTHYFGALTENQFTNELHSFVLQRTNLEIDLILKDGPFNKPDAPKDFQYESYTISGTKSGSTWSYECAYCDFDQGVDIKPYAADMTNTDSMFYNPFPDHPGYFVLFHRELYNQKFPFEEKSKWLKH